MLLVSILFVSMGHAENDFAKTFPKNTMAFVSFTDLSQLKKDFSSTNLYDIIQEPEVRALLEKILKHYKVRKNLREFSNKLKIAIGLTLEDVLSIFCGELSIALVDLPRGSEPIEVGAILQFKDQYRQAHHLLSEITERISAYKGSYQIGKYKVYYLKGLETAFHYVSLSDRFLFATSKSLLKKMLINQQNPQNSLQKNQKFQKFYQKVGTKALGYFYLDLAKFFERISAEMSSSEQRFFILTGISNWKATGASFQIQKKQFLSQLYLDMGEKYQGFNKFFSAGKIHPKTARYIPKNTKVFLMGKMDLPGIWSELNQIARGYDTRTYYYFKKELGRAEKGILGFTIDDLVISVGPHYSVFLIPNHFGGLTPRNAFLIESKNPKLLQKALSVIARLFQYRWVSKSYLGQQIYYLVRDTHYRKRLFYIDRSTREKFRWLVGSLSYYYDGKFFFFAASSRSYGCHRHLS